MPDALLEIRNLSCSIGGRAILRDINLEAREGETVVLLGRSGSGKTTLLKTKRMTPPERGTRPLIVLSSGSGKTTLLKTINGLVPLSGGVIRFAGRLTSEWDAISLRRSMGKRVSRRDSTAARTSRGYSIASPLFRATIR